MSVSLKLESIDINLSQLMLDPNNYRLSYDSLDTQYEDKFVVDLQDDIEKKLSKEKLSDLMDSILENGFLEVDRIVVRRLKGINDKYLVVEGNRRTAALKSLLHEHNEGYLNLGPDLLEKMSSLSVVLINSENENDVKEYQHTLMGVRHVSGPKKWTGMQSAKLICDLFVENKTASQIGSLLGISAIEANRRMRGYVAYKQLVKNEIYGSFTKSKHYALLLEFLSKKEARDWLDWSDEKAIQSSKHQKILYSHIVKLPENESVEISNPTQAREFCKAITIPQFRDMLEGGSMFSQLGPITEGLEEQTAEIKRFSVFVNSLKHEQLSSENRTSLKTITSKIEKLLEASLHG